MNPQPIFYAGPVTRQSGRRNCAAQATVNAVEIVANRKWNAKSKSDPKRLFKTIAQLDPINNKVGTSLQWAVAAADLGVSMRIYPSDTVSHVVFPTYQWLRSPAEVLDIAASHPVVVMLGIDASWKLHYKLLHPFGLPTLTPDRPCSDIHAVTIVGSTRDRRLSIMNSWGRMWGDRGFSMISYEFLQQRMKDAFVVINVHRGF